MSEFYLRSVDVFLSSSRYEAGIIIIIITMLVRVIWLACLLALGSASPTPLAARHVIHEKRDVAPPGWVARSRLGADVRIPLRIGLKQRNLELGGMYLDEVSNPRSPKYASHWTAEQVMDVFSPRLVMYTQHLARSLVAMTRCLGLWMQR